MHDLQLVGVHEDGQHLVLVDSKGQEYRVVLDDALRAAVRRDRTQLGQLQLQMTGTMRPKDVQALIRSGMSSSEVAEKSGWPIEKVHRFESPVLAERAYVAEQAQAVPMQSRLTGATRTLESLVVARLRGRGVSAADIEWDASRPSEHYWVVTVAYPIAGQQRIASWQFDPGASTLIALDDEARVLTADDEPDSPLLAAPSIASSPYDLTDGPFDQNRPAAQSLLPAASEEAAAAAYADVPPGGSHGFGDPTEGVSAYAGESSSFEYTEVTEIRQFEQFGVESDQWLDEDQTDSSSLYPIATAPGVPADPESSWSTDPGDRVEFEATETVISSAGVYSDADVDQLGDAVDESQPLRDLVDPIVQPDVGSDQWLATDDSDPFLEPVDAGDIVDPDESAASSGGIRHEDTIDLLGAMREANARQRRRAGSSRRPRTRVVEDVEPDSVAAMTEPADDLPAAGSRGAARRRPAGSRRRDGRPGVPAWDDVMFGSSDED